MRLEPGVSRDLPGLGGLWHGGRHRLRRLCARWGARARWERHRFTDADDAVSCDTSQHIHIRCRGQALPVALAVSHHDGWAWRGWAGGALLDPVQGLCRAGRGDGGGGMVGWGWWGRDGEGAPAGREPPMRRLDGAGSSSVSVSLLTPMCSAAHSGSSLPAHTLLSAGLGQVQAAAPPVMSLPQQGARAPRCS